MKLLVDECLNSELAKLTQEKGYAASHIVWLGKSGAKDWNLKPLIIDGDWAFAGPLTVARVAALGKNVIINALLILILPGVSLCLQHTNLNDGLGKYFQDNMIVGPSAFVGAAEGYEGSNGR